MSFDTRAQRLDVLFFSVTKNDRVIAKIAQISEAAQIAKAETRYRQLLMAKWKLRSTEAIVRAAGVVKAGGNTKGVITLIHASMAKWPKDVRVATKQTTDRIYRLSRTKGWKEATKVAGVQKAKKPLPPKPLISPSFDVKDNAAIAAIFDTNMFWIGEHYSEHVSAHIAAAVTATMLEKGFSKEKGGEIIRKIVSKILGEARTPNGFHSSAAAYFEMVAASVATTARAYGQIRSFAQVGITHYTITNPEDERTCPVCSSIAGTTFTVEQAADQIKRESAAKSPEELKAIHPWLSATKFSELGTTPEELAEAGYCIPPFHGICRCAVDVSLESMSYESLEPRDVF